MDDFFDVDPRKPVVRDEVSREVDRIVMSQQEAEYAKEQSALALCALTIEATMVVKELLKDNDPQVRARAVELVYSRTIPKVAAKHIEETGTIESADTVAMREDILARVKGKRSGD